MKETVARLNQENGDSMTTKELLERFFEEPLTTHGKQQAEFLQAEADLIDCETVAAAVGFKSKMRTIASEYRRSLEQGETKTV